MEYAATQGVALGYSSLPLPEFPWGKSLTSLKVKTAMRLLVV